MDVEAVMAQAADLLEQPQAWTQGRLARDADGQECNPASPRARSWCASGAIERIAGHGTRLAREARARLGWAIGDSVIHLWNDQRGRTQAEVVAAFRKAAEHG